SGEALEITHSIQSVVLDKTGTITQGKPEVTDMISDQLSQKELLSIAASLEAKSEHPLAEAIMEKARAEGTKLWPTQDFEAIPGRGIRANIDGKLYYAGNLKMMQENGIRCQ